MKIVRDSAIYVAGEIFAKIMPFIILPYLTRMLGVSEYGELSFSQTLVVIFSVIMSLSQENAISRYFYRYGQGNIYAVIMSGWLYATLIWIIITFFCFFSEIKNISIIATIALSQTMLGVILTVAQCKKKPILYVILQSFNGILSSVITVLVYEYIDPSVYMRLLSVLISSIISFILGGFFVYKYSQRNKVSYKKIKVGFFYILSFGAPLLIHQISLMLKGQLERVLIYDFYSSESLGIYSASYQISAVVLVLIMAINKAVTPYLYEGFRSGQICKKILMKWVCCSFLIIPIPSIIINLLPISGFVWFLGDGYESVKEYAVLFVLGFMFNIPYLILMNYLLYHGRSKAISITTVLSVSVYFLILYFVISISMKYIPLALVFSNLTSVIILVIMVSAKKHDGFKL